MEIPLKLILCKSCWTHLELQGTWAKAWGTPVFVYFCKVVKRRNYKWVLLGKEGLLWNAINWHQLWPDIFDVHFPGRSHRSAGVGQLIVKKAETKHGEMTFGCSQLEQTVHQYQTCTSKTALFSSVFFFKSALLLHLSFLSLLLMLFYSFRYFILLNSMYSCKAHWMTSCVG